MRNNKGVTITSLSIYVVVAAIVFSSLTFINTNYMSQIAELSQKSEYTNELLKAEASLISDIKAAGKVMEYSDHYVKFDNGVEYKIVYRANQKRGVQSYDVYELYRNDVLVTDKMRNISFDYTEKYDKFLQENYLTWITIKILDSNLQGVNVNVRVGKGY